MSWIYRGQDRKERTEQMFDYLNWCRMQGIRWEDTTEPVNANAYGWIVKAAGGNWDGTDFKLAIGELL